MTKIISFSVLWSLVLVTMSAGVEQNLSALVRLPWRRERLAMGQGLNILGGGVVPRNSFRFWGS